MKAEADKLDINKLVNVPAALNDLKRKVGNLNVCNLKTVPIEPKKLSDLANKKVAMSTKFNKLNTKSNKLDKKIPDTTTLIQMNQCNMDKQNLEKNWRC